MKLNTSFDMNKQETNTDKTIFTFSNFEVK